MDKIRGKAEVFIKCFVIVAFVVLSLVSKKINKKNSFFDNTDMTEIAGSQFLNEGNVAKQYIYFDEKKDFVVKFCFGTYGNTFHPEEHVVVKLLDDQGNELATRKISASILADHKMSGPIVFENNNMKSGGWYCLEVSVDFYDESKQIVILAVENKEKEKAYVCENNEKYDYNYKMIIGD